MEIAITTSSSVIIPKSPWLASAGWTKNEGVPVDASDAAIFLPMWPDLPIPVIIILPVEFCIKSRAFVRLSASRDFSSSSIALI